MTKLVCVHLLSWSTQVLSTPMYRALCYPVSFPSPPGSIHPLPTYLTDWGFLNGSICPSSLAYLVSFITFLDYDVAESTALCCIHLSPCSLWLCPPPGSIYTRLHLSHASSILALTSLYPTISPLHSSLLMHHHLSVYRCSPSRWVISVVYLKIYKNCCLM